MLLMARAFNISMHNVRSLAFHKFLQYAMQCTKVCEITQASNASGSETTMSECSKTAIKITQKCTEILAAKRSDKLESNLHANFLATHSSVVEMPPIYTHLFDICFGVPMKKFEEFIELDRVCVDCKYNILVVISRRENIKWIIVSQRCIWMYKYCIASDTLTNQDWHTHLRMKSTLFVFRAIYFYSNGAQAHAHFVESLCKFGVKWSCVAFGVHSATQSKRPSRKIMNVKIAITYLHTDGINCMRSDGETIDHAAREVLAYAQYVRHTNATSFSAISQPNRISKRYLFTLK